MWNNLIVNYRKFIPPQLREKLSKIYQLLPDCLKMSISPKSHDIKKYYPAILSQIKPLAVLKEHKVALKCLLDTFKITNVRGELLGPELWSDFLQAISQNDEDGKKFQNSLSLRLADIPGHRLEYWEWLNITKLFYKFGLFHLGYMLRIKARESAVFAIKNKSISDCKVFFKKCLAALIESNEWHLLRKYKEIDFLSSQERESFLFWDKLIHGDSASESFFKSKADHDFAEFVRDKRIAFVGPSRTKIKSASEIESFDIVARCNYKEPLDEEDLQVKGLRCDISYFNNTQTLFLCKRKLFEFPKKVKFAIFRSYESLRIFRSRFGKKTLTRLSINPTSSIFSGSLNGIPNALTDLLRFNTGQIKVFHTDLMLTVERSSGYGTPEESARPIEIFLSSCAGAHDPLTQFVFLKLMHRTGRIVGDKPFERLMKMSEGAYMKKLQNIYGNFARVLPASNAKLFRV